MNSSSKVQLCQMGSSFGDATSFRVSAFQGLLLMGIQKTSPVIGSAMQNLAPGFVFLIAACGRFENFEMSCNYTRAKVLGTLICLSGALFMSFLQNPPSTKEVTNQSNLATTGTYQDWILGCFYLLSAVVLLSSNIVLQAATMISFPAPFSLSVISSLIGATLTALLQIIAKGKLDVGSPIISMTSLIIFVLMGGLMGLSLSFQTWCVNQKGPVMVSIFNPIQPICSALLSAIFLRQFLNLASFAGMIIIFIGLYIVLWAKKKESSLVDVAKNDAHQNHDIEKPFLS